MLRLALLLALFPTIALADVTGPARVIDGNTLEIVGQRVHLHGIDAPEADQQCQNKRGKPYDCGINAARALRLLIADEEVHCKGWHRDRHGNFMAVCTIGRTDLNKQMVLQGWALADRRQSDDYFRAEKAARRIPEVLWKGRFVRPWEWRKGKRLAD